MPAAIAGPIHRPEYHYPDSWEWVSGDGVEAVPCRIHLILIQPMVIMVCLTAGNAIGTSTHCETVTIGALRHLLHYSHLMTAQILPFPSTDLSTNAPTAWVWTFGDGGGKHGC